MNRQQQQGWGAKVINSLAADLQKALYKRLRLQTKRTEFLPKEIKNEVAKIRSETNANTTKDSDLI
ncbi:hypothetical protein [Nostoc sp. C052]|uniref:hypothetical protein n=1 Tax=Nostoc sp. C052 TaxID=2576902 RepID=UPI002117467E|nr:hypothetical protein [Nostoc sp. C052]